ncbi:MAG: hypothetical protein HQM02_10370 [Magnetococcales bacterium]|nr:hypothetical protein [Magnetococcales bacterium]
MPVRRGLSILAFCLVSLPRLNQEVERVRTGMGLRVRFDPALSGRLEPLAFAGEALLLRLLLDVRRREEGLRARGFVAGLPQVRPPPFRSDWRDGLVLFPPTLLWFSWVL